MSKIDQYNLKASANFPLSGTEEANKNLQLTASPTSEEGVISGTVTSGGVGVAGVTVKVFDVNDNPIMHAITNPQGQYTIPAVIKGAYKITAAKTGYLTPLTLSVTVVANRPTTVNISLLPDPDATLNTLFGIVRQTGTLTPIDHATVNVFSVVDNTKTLISTTRTNSSGQYLSPYLPNGDYIVDVNKTGYEQAESASVNLNNAEIAPLDMFLIVNSTTNTGTVSGVISDQTTLAPIANATVALYLLSQASETIVKLTKTNAAGRYLFGDVPTGNYMVKAFSQKISIDT